MVLSCGVVGKGGKGFVRLGLRPATLNDDGVACGFAYRAEYMQNARLPSTKLPNHKNLSVT